MSESFGSQGSIASNGKNHNPNCVAGLFPCSSTSTTPQPDQGRRNGNEITSDSRVALANRGGLSSLRAMSKAFTRESDDLPDRPELPRPAVVLPPGAKNYLTPGGALRLRQELERLVGEERPHLAAAAAAADTPRQLHALDQRVHHLQHTLHTAVVTGPPAVADGVARFGATVTVRDRSGAESTYRIVGVDETNLDRNWVNWLSPIARALLNASVGQRVRLRLPAGDEELEILRVSYE